MATENAAYSIGTIEIFVVSDGTLKIGIDRLFPGIPRDEIIACGAKLDEQDRVHIPMNQLVVRNGGQTILVDTGVGNKPSVTLEGGGRLLEELARIGVRPEEIDQVVTTHAHPDHIGGYTRWQGETLVPTFPRARYWLHQGDRDYYTSPERVNELAHIRENLVPMAEANRMEFADGTTTEVVPGVTMLHTPGHSPGHCSIVFTSGNETGLFLGDIAHHPLHIEHPRWVAVFDVLPPLSLKTRVWLFEKVMREKMLVLTTHMPFPGVGHIVSSGGDSSGKRWQPLAG